MLDETVEEERFEVWPDNWDALSVFLSANTQWATTEVGPTGLRYESLGFLFDCHGVTKEDRLEMLHEIKVCERAALDEWSRKRGGA